jgi:cyclohexanone monooxygenase
MTHRSAIETPLDVAIVGAGFAGLYLVHRLRNLGLTVRAFDAASDVGGTWYWNRYPGARCDIESLQYSFSFDEELQQTWNWTERFATQPEILAYLKHVAQRFDLLRDIQLNTPIISVSHDDARNSWTLVTAQGETIRSQFCVMATGCLSASQLPDIPGRADFEGAVYHTARWPKGPVDLTGQRVGVIGTGSSAVQALPEIAREAGHLFVFQRTPNFSVPARNAPLTVEQIRFWKANHSVLRKQAREETRSGTIYDFPVKSALEATPDERLREFEARWAKGGANFMHAYNDFVVKEEANATAADFVREKIRSLVENPETAETLCPYDYPIFTKRICVDSGYYETFNRSNVTLVDLRKSPIERITGQGIQTHGSTYDLDAMIFATGFDAMTGALTRIPITGRDGVVLQQKWAEGPRTYLGLMSAGFPNLFMVTGPGSPSVLSNVVVSIEQHVDFISDCIVYARSRGFERIDVTPHAEEAWMAHVADVAQSTLLPRAASWYMGANIPGKRRIFMPYIGVSSYRQKCIEIVANGYEGFVFDAET